MTDALRSRNRRTARSLVLITVAMFGFGYALVPLYNVFCEVTGFNSRTSAITARTEVAEGVADLARTVTVEFDGTVNSALAWGVTPNQKRMQVHPGKIYEATYTAENLTGDALSGQAVPSVAPSPAARYFQKTECFCFTRQDLAPHEKRVMPVRFTVRSDLPREISTVTLSYTFFRADGRS
jgi:cytochrome c oxidase assembly protein subunit 11